MKLYLNLGSNKGDRFNNIDKAIALVSLLPWINRQTIKVSKCYESEAWGYDSENRFLNQGLYCETVRDIDPEEILDSLQHIEKSIDAGSHRDMTGKYIDRIIDIDIIAIDDIIIRTDRLQIPHPLMHLRRFVVEPMLELNPEWEHPILGARWKEILYDSEL